MGTTSLPNYSRLRASQSKKLQKLESIAARRLIEQSKDETFQYSRSPERYAEEVLRIRWWKVQKEIAQAVYEHDRVLVMSSFGIGKTHVAASLVNWFYDSFPRSTVVTTAPTADSVKNVLWKEIGDQRTTLPEAKLTQIRDPDNPAHIAVGLSPGERAIRDQFGTQAFRGLHAEFLLMVFDDAAGVPMSRWQSGEDIVVGTNNKWLAIGNPVVTSGPYWDAAHDGNWHVIQVSSLEHPNIAAGLAGKKEPYPGAVSLSWIEKRLNDPYWCERMGSPQGDEERDLWINDGAFEFPPESNIWYMPSPIAEAGMLGRFPSQSADAVWSMAWLEAAKIRKLTWEGGNPLELGVDIAYKGDDASAVHARRGPCSLLHRTWIKASVPSTVGRVAEALDQVLEFFPDDDLPPHVFIRVDTAPGTGVYDLLVEHYAQHSAVTVIGVSAQENPDDKDHFYRKRDELWMIAAERGRTGQLDLSRLDADDKDRLAAQLSAPTYDYQGGQYLRVEKKDDTKKRIGRSPDDADAFNLAYSGGFRYTPTDADAAELRSSSRWGAGGGRMGGDRQQESGSLRSTSRWSVGPKGRGRFSRR